MWFARYHLAMLFDYQDILHFFGLFYVFLNITFLNILLKFLHELFFEKCWEMSHVFK